MFFKGESDVSQGETCSTRERLVFYKGEIGVLKEKDWCCTRDTSVLEERLMF